MKHRFLWLCILLVFSFAAASQPHAPAKVISTVAGNGVEGINGDGGSALSASFSRPTQVAVDRLGNLYIADYGNSRIRKVDRNGLITAFAGSGEAQQFPATYSVDTQAN